MAAEQLIDPARQADAVGPKVTVFGQAPPGLLAADCRITVGRSPHDVEGSDYILMTIASFRAYHGAGASDGGRIIDLTAKRLIHERDIREAAAGRGDTLKVARDAIVTSLACDYAQSLGVKLAQA
ncbi:MAG: hypothetical protein LBH76_00145 [Propionibacteriaceae bacterium]|nr:hypothetical protein [Propionibacteriaceae bacterium]